MLLFCCFSLIFLQIFFTFLLCEGKFSCLNEEGQPIDWFIVYKLPKYKQGDVGSGVEYMYLDSSVSTWQKSQYAINTTEGAVSRTLNQLYISYKSNSAAYMLYNDAPPDLKYEKMYGHSKGLLLFDKSQGFWISHSIPHFPPFPEKGFDYPSTGKLFGQTVLCITYNYTQFQKILQQLGYVYPHAYNCSVPEAFSTDLPVMLQICAGKPVFITSTRRLEKLLSSSGEEYLNFAKSHNYVDDIYAGWVAQTLRTDLLVESWQREPHQLPSNCSLPFDAINIRKIQLPGPLNFFSYDDHAKWCVSWNIEAQWACLGDLNREIGQAWRGGGLICTQNPTVYKAFRMAVAWYKNCSSCLVDNHIIYKKRYFSND